MACYLAYLVARDWWSDLEGRVAALLMAFFTTFYLPSAVIAFAPDALMIVPHLAAVYCARRARPIESGAFVGIAFLVNTKAVFVLAVCGVFLWPAVLPLAFGFVLPLLIGLAWLLGIGAWTGYREQVWGWGAVYAKYSPVTDPGAPAYFERSTGWDFMERSPPAPQSRSRIWRNGNAGKWPSGPLYRLLPFAWEHALRRITTFNSCHRW